MGYYIIPYRFLQGMIMIEKPADAARRAFYVPKHIHPAARRAAGCKKSPRKTPQGKCIKRPACCCIHNNQGSTKGCEEMDMNTAALLVQQAQAAERLRILLIAHECKTLDELVEKLRALANK